MSETYRFVRLLSSAISGSSSRKPVKAIEASTTHIPSELHIKLVLVGGKGVGKSTLVRRWAKQPYNTTYSTTIGIDVTTIKYPYQEMQLMVHFWDVSSAELENPSLHAKICDGAAGVFFVFNVNRVSTIQQIDAWREVLEPFISCEDVPFVLLAHKADLAEKRVMSSYDIDAFAKGAGFIDWKWTVGRAGLGENYRQPATQEALQIMINDICKRSEMARLLDPIAQIYKKEWWNIEPSLPVASSDKAHERLDPVSISILREQPQVDRPFVTQDHNDAIVNEMGSTWIFQHQPFPQRYSIASSTETFERSRYSSAQQSLDEGSVFSDDSSVMQTEIDTGWNHFAGSISRSQAADILRPHQAGSFLIRRKDACTLVFSYITETRSINHVLLSYKDRRYHVIGVRSKKPRGYVTLEQCIKSFRRIASHGLKFKAHRELLSPRTSSAPIAPPTSMMVVDLPEKAHDVSWRRQPEQTSIMALQTIQSDVTIPPVDRIQAIGEEFYSDLRNQLQSKPKSSLTLDLLKQADDEKEKVDSLADQSLPDQVEAVWRTLVADIVYWQRIMQNLVNIHTQL